MGSVATITSSQPASSPPPAERDATGRRVVSGPIEATALGNIAMQMLATGAAGSLADARDIIDRSFPVERFDPRAHDQWDAQYPRFREYVEVACA